ncbi:hypothetical protein AB1Y20_006146 [Prymnesium parvum]|uniref:Uncharacterized protein n=1 Tax=Prymnesium parvum TaxID=97485 RepID=A0AB34J3V3_PRYPA
MAMHARKTISKPSHPSPRPSQLIEDAFAAFKAEAAKEVESNYNAAAASTRDFERTVRKVLKGVEARCVAEVEGLSKLKQALSQAKAGIKETHALEHAAASEIGAHGAGVARVREGGHACAALGLQHHRLSVHAGVKTIEAAKAITERSKRQLEEITGSTVPCDQELGLGDDD